MCDVNIPDLTFQMVEFGKRVTPWNLRPLLYKGGAMVLANKAASLIDAGAMGPLIVERIDLVRRTHEEIKASIVGGGSRKTAIVKIDRIRKFFGFADSSGLPMNMETVASAYIHWTDHLLHQVRVVKNIRESTAYNCGALVGVILDKVLERTSPILSSTRLTKPQKGKRIRGVEADKQRLDETFAFGYALLDIADALHLEALWGSLPLRIRLRSGKECEEWSGLKPPEKVQCLNPKNAGQRYHATEIKLARQAWENDRTLRTRYAISSGCVSFRQVDCATRELIG